MIEDMKKMLLFALPLMAMCFTSCEKDNGNNGEELSGDDVIQFKDPNFLKALLVVQEIVIYDAKTNDYVPYTMDVDKNKDGQITVNEAKDVKGLDLFDLENDEYFYFYNIADISEIKYFTALIHLNCEQNQLTSLDLGKNTALIFLDCYGNQLTSLDLSNNTALRALVCDNNQLTSLDVSNSTALTDLYCASNQLTSLDVSNSTALTELWCEDNPLETLTISASQQSAYWMDDVKGNYPNLNIIVK